eukprot:6189242-Pleurochrysis_carterae.AAC.1
MTCAVRPCEEPCKLDSALADGACRHEPPAEGVRAGAHERVLSCMRVCARACGVETTTAAVKPYV